MFICPFQSGKLYFILPEMIHGMKGRELFPYRYILISVPHQRIPTVVQYLNKIQRHLPSDASRKQYLAEFGEIPEDLSDKAGNP